jgi:O-methyltransferase domain
MSQQHPHETVWTLATAAVGSRCMHLIADLGVADSIGDQPVAVSELASSCGADPDALDRVLRLLAAHGIFKHQADAYLHTPSSRLLRSDHPMSMHAFVRMMGLPSVWGSVTKLEHSVRTGSPAINAMEPKGFWAYLQDRPDEARIFGQAMTAKAAADIAAVLAAYDFSRFRTIADIGGGRGHLLRAVLAAVPNAEGLLFDLPEVIDTLELDQERLTTRAGDFFVDPLPAADAYVLMDVIHDWGDAEAVAILSAIRHAAPAGAALLVIEGVVAENEADPRTQTLDIIMLSVTGGRERTANQLEELFKRAGFSLRTVIDTASPMRVVEATVV